MSELEAIDFELTQFAIDSSDRLWVRGGGCQPPPNPHLEKINYETDH